MYCSTSPYLLHLSHAHLSCSSSNTAGTQVPLPGMFFPSQPTGLFTQPSDSNVTSGKPSLATFQTSHPHSQLSFPAQTLNATRAYTFSHITFPSPPTEICFDLHFNLFLAYPLKFIQQTQSAYHMLCTILVTWGREKISPFVNLISQWEQ